MKLGYEFRRTSISQIFNRNFRGILTFNTLSDFLNGMPTGGGSQFQGNTNRNTFENSHGWYVQDSFRWTPRFTLNLGVRWDYYGVVDEKKNLLFNFDPMNGLRQEGSPTLNRLYEPDYKNFAPRLSLAWDVTGKGHTVVRAGYGIFFDAFSQDFFLGHLPFGSSFDHGPAYSGIGPSPILSGSADPTQTLNSSTPIFSGFTPITDAFESRHLRLGKTNGRVCWQGRFAAPGNEAGARAANLSVRQGERYGAIESQPDDSVFSVRSSICGAGG